LTEVEIYRSETREILTRFREDRITRSECIAALDAALLAAIPELDAADLPAVQMILVENSQSLAEIDETRHYDNFGSQDQPEPLLGSYCH